MWRKSARYGFQAPSSTSCTTCNQTCAERGVTQNAPEALTGVRACRTSP
ncbi:hypothetical protein SSAG_04901 [Streptomyces sp. Mg1]|nr:hypothetical protein SSAG_04901 [Streptomyces sp. Mg1]